jgi:hypothetical protein
MPRFSITISSGSPIETQKALTAAGISVLGPSMGGFVRSGARTDLDMQVLVDADTPAEAEEEIRSIVGAEPEIGSAEPY